MMTNKMFDEKHINDAVTRSLYMRTPTEDSALCLSAGYLDGELTREEVFRSNIASDTFTDWGRRRSMDNGRTWTPTTPLDDMSIQLPAGGITKHMNAASYCDVLNMPLRIIMRRSWPGGRLYTFSRDFNHPVRDHTFVLEDESREVMLNYEDGPGFDPDDPFANAFLDSNVAFRGVSFTWDEDGTVFYPIVCRSAEHNFSLVRGGVILMRRDPGSGTWMPSNSQYIDPALSSRGLLEPDAAILADGSVLIVMRGANTGTTAGRKWMCISRDGGATITSVREFRYADGSRFFSPSSIHGFIRSKKTGRLYWIANICGEPPEGNLPRYPLCISEIDESVAGVRRESQTVIDDREEAESPHLKLSNFSVIENRETLDFELYMNRLHMKGNTSRTADVYKYVIDPGRIGPST